MSGLPTNGHEHSISVVVPLYMCGACVSELCARLAATLSTLTDRFEIVLVDDRSPDGTWEIIQELRQEYPTLEAVRLSRNFGQHIAITAGLARARGDFVVVMDGDLQDPPEMIPTFYDKVRDGFDLVLGRRIDREHSLFRRSAARLYFRVMSKLTEEDIDGIYGNLSILSRKVVDEFLRFGERERHYLFIVRWLGFKAGSVDYSQHERTIGNSSYSVRKLVAHAIDGLLFQSTVLLRWIVGLGFASALGGMGLAMAYVYQYFSHGLLAGWTTVVVLILFSTGVILMSLGVTGLYIGKVFDQGKSRPLYVLDEQLPRSPTW